MLALAGNKNDMYEKEEVEENEGKEYAKKINAIFQKTSAKESTGIEDLFIKIGKKILESQNEELNMNKNETKDDKIKIEIKEDKTTIKLDKNKIEEKQKKGCC